MKPMKKRLLSLLLTLVTILSLLPTSAFAASNTGSGLKITTNQAYWSTRLLANGTPYSYRPPLVDGKLVYCMDSGLGYHYATPSYLNSFTWTSGTGADADAVLQSALTNSGLSEMDAATVENVKWMMTYLNDCKESNVGQLFMAVQTYVWENQSYKGEPGGDGDAGGYANADTYELYLSLIDSLLAKKAAEDDQLLQPKPKKRYEPDAKVTKVGNDIALELERDAPNEEFIIEKTIEMAALMYEQSNAKLNLTVSLARKLAQTMVTQDEFNRDYFTALASYITLGEQGKVVLHTKTETEVTLDDGSNESS